MQPLTPLDAKEFFTQNPAADARGKMILLLTLISYTPPTHSSCTLREMQGETYAKKKCH